MLWFFVAFNCSFLRGVSMKLGRISALIGAATVALGIAAFPSSAHALTYAWDINLSVNGYTATGQIYTDTNILNTLLGNNVTDYTIQVSNGVISDTLKYGSTTGSGLQGLQIDPTGNFLVVLQDGNFASVDITNANGSRLYFGYPLLTGLTPNLLIAVNGSSSGSTTSSVLGSTIFATASVPFEIPGGATVPAIGALLVLGAIRRVRKSIASNTDIANPVCETVS
jgi:hypothetical protein